MNVFDELIRLVGEAGKRLGAEAEADGQEVRDYIKARAFHLAGIINEPGYDEALEAERDNVLLKMGLTAVEIGDAADAELKGMLTSGLGIIASIVGRGI